MDKNQENKLDPSKLALMMATGEPIPPGTPADIFEQALFILRTNFSDCCS